MRERQGNPGPMIAPPHWWPRWAGALLLATVGLGCAPGGGGAATGAGAAVALEVVPASATMGATYVYYHLTPRP